MIRPGGTGYICGSLGIPATPDDHAIWHRAYPWPAGGWHVNETKRRADLPQWQRQDVTIALVTMPRLGSHGCEALVTKPWDQHDKTVARAPKRAMLVTMGRRNSIHMARVHKPKVIKCLASWRLCNTGTGTSATGEDVADVVLATFSTGTAARIMRSVLQQTICRHVRHG